MNSPMTNDQLPMTNYQSRLVFPLVLASIVLFIFAVSPARAMPEYAARVGEPCATCHVSPAGGGLRNVRGQAWVASDKPAVVPSTEDALKILGVQLPADMSIYTAAPATIPTPAPMKSRAEKFLSLFDTLILREGN